MLFVTMAAIQIAYVALNSLRVVLMIKGKRAMASLISTMEILIYIVGLSLVLNNLDSVVGVTVYCASYGIGVSLGMYIEKRIALGYVCLQMISEKGQAICVDLRERGYGVTTWIGHGGNGERTVAFITARRKDYGDLSEAILSRDPKAFMIALEPTTLIGGFWRK